MNEEGSLFDVPPAAIGRYRVRQPIGTGTTGPVFHAEDPETHAPVAIKLFKVDLSPEEAHTVAQALGLLVGQTPRHDALTSPLDAGLDEIEAFLVTPLVAGASLESALKEYGPAAIEDVVPRLRNLADALDAAHDAGLVHGALHPKDILVSAATTTLTGVGVGPILARSGIALPVRRPFSAPEAVTANAATAAADQFALAAITFEWLFGRRISGPAQRPVEVRALPGVNREALADAFTIALALDPSDRFTSCRAFCDAVAGAVNQQGRGLSTLNDDHADPIHHTAPLPLSLLDEAMMAPPLPEGQRPSGPVVPARVNARLESMSAPPENSGDRFGGGALIATLIVGMIVGFAAGYMARPRALQSGPPQRMASGGTESTIAPVDSAEGRAPSVDQGAPARKASAPVTPTPSSLAPQAPEALQAPTNVGRLLVRSTPSGAAVQVDGVARGVTPLVLRDLELGPRSVVIARRGYIAEDRRVVLTGARPSRSLEVRLTTESPAAPRPSTPATLGRPAASATGTLAVDSRPAGAVVTINGRPSGTTPVMLDALTPGDYRVGMTLVGYLPFATTVRVVAGERARAAASLSAQERE